MRIEKSDAYPVHTHYVIDGRAAVHELFSEPMRSVFFAILVLWRFVVNLLDQHHEEVEIYNNETETTTCGDLSTDLNNATTWLSRLFDVASPPRVYNRDKKQLMSWARSVSVHMIIDHAPGIYERAGCKFGNYNEEAVEMQHRQTKEIAHQYNFGRGSIERYIQKIQVAKNSIIDRGQLRIHAARNLKKTRARSHKNEKMRERYEAKAVMEMLQQCWKGSSSCSEANQYRKAFSNKWKVEWTSSTPRVVFDDPSGFIPPYWAKTSGKADETDAAEFDAIGDTVLPLAVGRDVAEDPAAFMRIAEADNDATEMTGGAVGAAAEAEASDEPDLETATEVAEETEEEQIVLPAAGDRMETEELAREAEAADREAEAAGGSPSLPPTHAPTARGLPAPTPTAKPAPKPTRRGNKAGRKQQGQAHRGQPARRRSARSSGSELR